MASFAHRIVGAALLDVATYEEVEADRSATLQACGVVLLSSLAAGIGAGGSRGVMPSAIALVTGVSLLAWAAWALVTYEIGSRLLPEPQTRVDVGELLRTIGFATSPGLLRVLGLLPGVAVPMFALCAVWMLVAMVVAVRQALDYTSTGRALAVCGLGWALSMAIALILGLAFGPSLALE